MQLSEHFTLYELTRSPTAKRLGIDNTPTPEVVDNLRSLTCTFLQPLRSRIGKPVQISSGFRCEKLNKAVGGAEDSDHKDGNAADFEVWGMSNLELARLIVSMELPYDSLILEHHSPEEGPNSGWIHASHRAIIQRRRVFTAVRKGGETKYLNGLPKDRL